MDPSISRGERRDGEKHKVAGNRTVPFAPFPPTVCGIDHDLLQSYNPTWYGYGKNPFVHLGLWTAPPTQTIGRVQVPTISRSTVWYGNLMLLPYLLGN